MDNEDLRPIPFWFSPLWIDRDGFLAIVINAWSIPVIGSPYFVWERKLKNTKSVLKDWIKQSLQSPSSDRIQALARLEDIQLEMEESEITLAIMVKEQKAQFNSFRAFRKEEEFW